MNLPNFLYYDSSPIHGTGVFAKEPIEANRRLMEFVGTEMSYKDFVAKYGNDWRYTYRRMPWQKVITCKENRNAISYVNDGVYQQEKPYFNCVLKRSALYSVKPIKAGEELLLDYGKKYWRHHPSK